MLLLSLDTSIRGCSVAVHADSVLLAAYDLYTDRSSSAMLTTLMKSAVENAGFKLSDLDAIAVAKGPGSYTGLRVGVSTAKGLCYALDKPLIAVNTLEAMSLQVIPFFPKGSLFCPMIDARRMEVYAAIYDADLHVLKPVSADVLDDASYAEFEPFVFFGDGAAKVTESWAGRNILFDNELRPSATGQISLAYAKLLKGEVEDVAYFEPFYLKEFVGTVKKTEDKA